VQIADVAWRPWEARFQLDGPGKFRDSREFGHSVFMISEVFLSRETACRWMPDGSQKIPSQFFRNGGMYNQMLHTLNSECCFDLSITLFPAGLEFQNASLPVLTRMSFCAYQSRAPVRNIDISVGDPESVPGCPQWPIQDQARYQSPASPHRLVISVAASVTTCLSDMQRDLMKSDPAYKNGRINTSIGRLFPFK
jgi:hypothetical protein